MNIRKTLMWKNNSLMKLTEKRTWLKTKYSSLLADLSGIADAVKHTVRTKPNMSCLSPSFYRQDIKLRPQRLREGPRMATSWPSSGIKKTLFVSWKEIKRLDAWGDCGILTWDFCDTVVVILLAGRADMLGPVANALDLGFWTSASSSAAGTAAAAAQRKVPIPIAPVRLPLSLLRWPVSHPGAVSISVFPGRVLLPVPSHRVVLAHRPTPIPRALTPEVGGHGPPVGPSRAAPSRVGPHFVGVFGRVAAAIVVVVLVEGGLADSRQFPGVHFSFFFVFFELVAVFRIRDVLAAVDRGDYIGQSRGWDFFSPTDVFSSSSDSLAWRFRKTIGGESNRSRSLLARARPVLQLLHCYNLSPSPSSSTSVRDSKM